MDRAELLGIMGEGRKGECAKWFSETDDLRRLAVATFWQHLRQITLIQ
jgi:hypothetical protein